MLLLWFTACTGGKEEDTGTQDTMGDGDTAVDTDTDTGGDTDTETSDTGNPWDIPDCGPDLWGIADGNITDMEVEVDIGASYAEQWGANCAGFTEPRNYHVDCPEDVDLLVSFFLGTGYAEEVSDYFVSGEDDMVTWLSTQTGITGIQVLSDDYSGGGDTLSGQVYLCLSWDYDPNLVDLRKR